MYSFPSAVMPAEIDFPALISVNLILLIALGRELLVYCPRPSSPFLPEPQAQRSASLDFNEYTPQGIARAMAAALKNLLNFIKNN